MKKTIRKTLFVKNLVQWAVVAAGCLLALGVFAKNFVADQHAGQEIFLPSVLVLTLAVAALFIFAVTRVVKYARRMREK
jgi:hypothetical protein